jgi:Cys-tRNA(Pro) deacylase
VSADIPWVDLREFLRARGVPARFHTFEGKTTTVAEATAQLKVEPSRIVKTIVMISESGAPIIGMVTGAKRVSWNKLQKVAGVGSLRLATHEEVYRHTGFPAGGTPPVGHKGTLPIYIDHAVLSQPAVIGGGGELNALLEMSPADIVRLTRAIPADIGS